MTFGRLLESKNLSPLLGAIGVEQVHREQNARNGAIGPDVEALKEPKQKVKKCKYASRFEFVLPEEYFLDFA